MNEVEVMPSCATTFCQLSIGDLFWYRNEVYIKFNQPCGRLHPVACDAVRLCDGGIAYLSDDDPVERVIGNVTLKQR